MQSQTPSILVRLHQRWLLSGEHAALEYRGDTDHSIATTCDGGRIQNQLVDQVVGSTTVAASRSRARRYGRNVLEPRRSQGGQCGEGSGDSVYAVEHGCVRRA